MTPHLVHNAALATGSTALEGFGDRRQVLVVNTINVTQTTGTVKAFPVLKRHLSCGPVNRHSMTQFVSGEQVWR
jgi:hypothetical protein